MSSIWDVRTDSSQVRLKLFCDDRFALAYNTGGPTGDFYRPRPDFYPVYSPMGYLLTDQSTYRHAHHASIWLGHGRVGHRVNNFYHNTPHDGRIITRRIAVETHEKSVRLGSELEWVNIRSGVDLQEIRLVEITRGDNCYIMDWLTRLKPPERHITMLQDNHSLLCFRVADTMDVEDGGQIVNSNGQINEEACMGQAADWIDYSGLVGAHRCGITLMNHPTNVPSGWFVRNYGTICLSPFLTIDRTLNPDVWFDFRARFVLHDGSLQDVPISPIWEAFTRRSEWPNPLESGGTLVTDLRF